MDHTSQGIVECQGQNPCCIIAGLTKQVGGAQVSNRKVMKMLIKCCLIFVSILQRIEMNTVTGMLLSTIKDWDLLHQRHFCVDYCALQELLMKMNFTIAVAPPSVHPMMSLPTTPTHSVQKYGFFSEPTRRRQVAKYGNLKHYESLSFSGDIESLEPSKF